MFLVFLFMFCAIATTPGGTSPNEIDIYDNEPLPMLLSSFITELFRDSRANRPSVGGAPRRMFDTRHRDSTPLPLAERRPPRSLIPRGTDFEIFTSSCVPGSILQYVRGTDVAFQICDGSLFYPNVVIGRLGVEARGDLLFTVPPDFDRLVRDRLSPYSFHNCTADAIGSLPDVQIRFAAGHVQLYPEDYLELDSTTNFCRPKYRVVATDAHVTIIPEAFPQVRTSFYPDLLLIGDSLDI